MKMTILEEIFCLSLNVFSVNHRFASWTVQKHFFLTLGTDFIALPIWQDGASLGILWYQASCHLLPASTVNYLCKE